MSAETENLPGMVGRHPAMLEVYRRVRRYAPTMLPITIVGETGTGKELVARAVHELSDCRSGPFVDINCAALPESLADGELFGWERGAFTGALGSKVGVVEAAHGGTLFLDEACSLAPALQAKLLRVMEQHEFRRLGAQGPRRSAFRIVVALSEPAELLIRTGRLRSDFVYRVATVTVSVPPLRTRTCDLGALADYLLGVANRNGHADRYLAPDACNMLAGYSWPGNVRELKSLIERLEVESRGPVVSSHDVARQVGAVRARGASLAEALAANEWSVTRTARALGIHRATIYRHMEALGIRRPPRATHQTSHATSKVSHATVSALSPHR